MNAVTGYEPDARETNPEGELLELFGGTSQVSPAIATVIFWSEARVKGMLSSKCDSDDSFETETGNTTLWFMPIIHQYLLLVCVCDSIWFTGNGDICIVHMAAQVPMASLSYPAKKKPNAWSIGILLQCPLKCSMNSISAKDSLTPSPVSLRRCASDHTFGWSRWSCNWTADTCGLTMWISSNPVFFTLW